MKAVFNVAKIVGAFATGVLLLLWVAAAMLQAVGWCLG